MEKNADSLKNLIAKIQYDSSWGIWAIAPFTPTSPARYGQKNLKNGGLLDSAIFFADGLDCGDFISYYWEGTPEDEISDQMRDEANLTMIFAREEERIREEIEHMI